MTASVDQLDTMAKAGDHVDNSPPSGSVARTGDGVMALDAQTPIVNQYLTHRLALPLPNSAGLDSSETDLLSGPDLRKYTDPLLWSSSRKTLMVVLSCVGTFGTAYTAGAYSPPADIMAAEFGVSKIAVLVGVTTFCTGFAIAPMILAPFSEVNGRYPVFMIAGFFFTVFQVICAVVQNLAGMLVSRFFLGVAGSVFSTMVGGVIADLYEKENRNAPMSVFAGAALAGTGLGPLVGAVMTHRWKDQGGMWRWIFWHQVILDAAIMLSVVFFFAESRGSVLLSRKAKVLNQWYEKLEAAGVYGVWAAPNTSEGGFGVVDTEKGLDTPKAGPEAESRGYQLKRIRWVVKADEERSSLVVMITSSLFRPFQFLTMEPIVLAFSLWVSFAWAVLYLTFGSIPLVFQSVYGFSTEQAGYVFCAMVIGAILATLIGIYQEKMLKHPDWQRKTGKTDDECDEVADQSKFWSFMRRRFPTESPESRLYFTCLTSILLPLGLYLFGFSSKPDVHWMAPALAICIATMGIYYVYLATFNYLADIYQAYASSALAAQSFCRNILGGIFPLVTAALFTNLGNSAAGGLLGGIATLLGIVPWVLVFFGERIRSKSKFAVVSQTSAMRPLTWAYRLTHHRHWSTVDVTDSEDGFKS